MGAWSALLRLFECRKMDFGVKYSQEKLWATALGAAWSAGGGILDFGVHLKQASSSKEEL